MSKNAIKGSCSILGQDANYYAPIIVDSICNNLNVKAVTLGSTGKKPDWSESGDIDIAIELPFTKGNITKVKEYLKKEYGDNVQIYVSDGFKIVSFGFRYKCIATGLTNTENYVQVDLMFSDDLEYSKFMYHSPDYRNNESNFKGLYRTNLLVYIAGRCPHDHPDVYDDKNRLTDYWKYTLTYDKGLVFTHKTYKGKTKLLKNPVTVKEDTKLISKDPLTIIKFILGLNADLSTVNSFESLITYLFSNNYPYKDQISDILCDYLDDERQQPKMRELITYINNVIGNEPVTVEFLIENLLDFVENEYTNK